jgi:sugar lactone lactonase YvrE
MIHRRHLLPLVAAVAVGLAVPATAQAAPHQNHHAFPATLKLPNGFQPEGIAIGPGAKAYFGSLADGDIYRVDLATGRGKVISEGPGTPSVGLKSDGKRWLFIAGGPAGNGRVVDLRSGEILASYQLTTEAATFVNDVVLTGDAAWFTDSQQAVLYKLPLRHGKLPKQSQVQTLPLTGDYVQQDESVTAGDGLLTVGRTLYVVRNQLNLVAAFELDKSGREGELVKTITDRRFDVPTTVAVFGNRLYLPNARFNTPPTPDTPYTAVAVRR